MNQVDMSTTSQKTSKTLILGLGNELLGDDAVGIKVVQELCRRLPDRDDVTLQEASVAGMAFLDLLRGYRNLIMVDAIQTKKGEPGEIYRLSEDDLAIDDALWSAHGMGLRTVLETGRRCGCPLPERIIVYAVEVAETQTWRKGCTRRVREAIPEVAQRILDEELLANPLGSTKEHDGVV